MTEDVIRVTAAREHNLQNISLEIPKNKLVVITGLSGSGKSSLAFDTLFAEGQRRYVESLSAYARQFLGSLPKPDVDSIDGLSPAVAIDQRSVAGNPRSTVGTITEIYDYLRLLFARIGTPHCPRCGREVQRQSAEEITIAISALPAGTRLAILAPVVHGRKGVHRTAIEELRAAGFVRMRVDGQTYETDAEPELAEHVPHSIEVVVDRLILPSDLDDEFRTRLTDSVESALRTGGGLLIAQDISREPAADILFSEHFACPVDGISLPDLQPSSFSFNSPHGACPACQGIGSRLEIDPQRMLPDRSLSLLDAALPLLSFEGEEGQRSQTLWLESIAAHLGFDPESPIQQLTETQLRTVLYGTGAEKVRIELPGREGRKTQLETAYEGLIPYLRRRYEESDSDSVRDRIAAWMSERACEECGGRRLRKESLAVTVGGRDIISISEDPVQHLREWMDSWMRSVAKTAQPQRVRAVADPILKEVRGRLDYLCDVGLGYLSLARTAHSLSGGEGQRIRMATQIGSRLSGVLYVLDEPSVGLHPHDTGRLLRSLVRMRDLRNTVLVVEHDEDIIRAADWVVELGPGAGPAGGRLMAAGTPESLARAARSLTGRLLAGKLRIPVPASRRAGNGHSFVIRGARAHNLQNIDVRIPLGTMVCITGVSGSGKSSLLVDVIEQSLLGERNDPGPWDSIDGRECIEKVIAIDQSPIGRTPRSNPASYVGLYAEIRDLFASLPASKVRGYKSGRFSFNARGGRCEACQGQGEVEVSMQFLPDVFVPCEVCGGARFNRETLQVRFKERTIADVLSATVEEGRELFAAFPGMARKLDTLGAVGLGYIRLGQPGTTLSGGEAQRVKLARELSRRASGHTLYLLDEPSIGLHAADVHKLLEVLQRLVEDGHTVCVIEHHPDVMKSADFIIDLGPEGGDAGGRLVAQGTPEEVAQCAGSFTGQYLAGILAPAALPKKRTK
jgi:excinuclease ABC subunit A